MPRGVHDGPRGRKPLGPLEREARRRAATRRASRRWRAKNHPPKQRPPRGPQQTISTTAARSFGLSCLTAHQTQRPRYFYLDRHGNLQIEEWEPPDELVARLEKKGVLSMPKKPDKTPENPGVLIDTYLDAHGLHGTIELEVGVLDARWTIRMTSAEAREFLREHIDRIRQQVDTVATALQHMQERGEPIEADWTAWLASRRQDLAADEQSLAQLGG